MAHLGELIAELRQDRGLTQKELGDILCVSSGTISNYENGVTSRMLIRSLLLQTTFMSQPTTCSVAPRLISLLSYCSKPSPMKRLSVM